ELRRPPVIKLPLDTAAGHPAGFHLVVAEAVDAIIHVGPRETARHVEQGRPARQTGACAHGSEPVRIRFREPAGADTVVADIARLRVGLETEHEPPVLNVVAGGAAAEPTLLADTAEIIATVVRPRVTA